MSVWGSGVPGTVMGENLCLDFLVRLVEGLILTGLSWCFFVWLGLCRVFMHWNSVCPWVSFLVVVFVVVLSLIFLCVCFIYFA